MRHDDRHQKHHRRHERHAEFRERKHDLRAAKLPPRPVLEALYHASLAACGGESLSFDVKRGDVVRAVIDRANGPVDIDFLIGFLRTYRDALREKGFDPDDLDLEVDSPGEERELRTPAHWSRFQGSAVRIELKAGGPQIRGSLLGERDGALLVRTDDGQERRLEANEIRVCRLAPP
jgi:ribosome maturation factor RimP